MVSAPRKSPIPFRIIPMFDQVARDHQVVARLPRNGQRAPGVRERIRMPPLMPVQQADAAQRIALERGLSELAAEPQRRAQRAFRGIEAFEERGHVSLSQVRLGQSRRRASGRQEGDELFDNLLLTAAQAERLAEPLLLEQQIHEHVRAAVAIGQVRDPAPDALQRRQRVGELGQRSRELGRPAAVADRLGPCLGV